MKKEIKSKELVEILVKRTEALESGYPLFDNIEKVVSKVIKNNLKRIAADNDAWLFLKPYIEEKEYKQANKELADTYRQLQKLEYNMQRLKDKVTPFIADIKLKEFEEVGSVKIDNGKAYAEIIDKVEEYKKMLREKADKK